MCVCVCVLVVLSSRCKLNISRTSGEENNALKRDTQTRYSLTDIDLLHCKTEEKNDTRRARAHTRTHIDARRETVLLLVKSRDVGVDTFRDTNAIAVAQSANNGYKIQREKKTIVTSNRTACLVYIYRSTPFASQRQLRPIFVSLNMYSLSRY